MANLLFRTTVMLSLGPACKNSVATWTYSPEYGVAPAAAIPRQMYTGINDPVIRDSYLLARRGGVAAHFAIA